MSAWDPVGEGESPISGSPLREAIGRVGHALGLDAVGVADAVPTERTAFVREWWARGFGGEMGYLGRRLEERVDPRRVLPEARSMIVVGLACAPSYAPPQELDAADSDERGPSRGRIARYAGGDDYHEVLLDRVRALEASLSHLAQRPVQARSYVDTGPILERAAAERAGLGWIGKNSCLIHPELGSHLMLGVILCDLVLPREEGVADHCGTCRACLDVCPTDAFPEPYVLDATRCLSYTTIELRGAIPEPLREAQGDHVFGCDLCQTVCPWNRSRPRTPLADPLGLRERLAPREAWQAPTLAWLLGLDEEAYREATVGTALRRAGHRGLLRNALIAAGNAGDARLRDAVSLHLDSGDAVIAEHAAWALARLEAGPEGARSASARRSGAPPGSSTQDGSSA